MKVDVENWSENSKDKEGHLAKYKAVGKLIKIKAIYHEICKTVAKNFQTRDWPAGNHFFGGDYTCENQTS